MKEKILEIMNDTFGIDNADEETSQKNCATWDSMNHLNLILGLEEEFEVSFEPEEIAQMTDFKAVEKMLAAKIEK